MFLQRQPRADAQPFKTPVRAMGLLVVASGVVPFFILQSLVPVLRNGTHIWLASILPVVILPGLLGGVFGYGLIKRQSWYSSLALGLGWVLLAAYGLGALLGVAIMVGLAPRAHPDLGFVSVVNVLLWLIFSPCAWLLWRLVHREDWRALPRA